MPTPLLRPTLARDGIFNARDLGGIALPDGGRIASGRVVRADSLHRARQSAAALRDYGVVRVLDLRDERERAEDGVMEADGVEVQHHPVLDPAFAWSDDDHGELATLLAQRYEVVLGEFPDRLVGAIESIAEVVAADDTSAVAYHCAVGKDRTGLLTMLLLGLLGVHDDEIVADYARSAAATAVQVSWLWTFGHPAGSTDDDELALGVWSARPETMVATLRFVEDRYGGPVGLPRAGRAQRRRASGTPVRTDRTRLIERG